jgi:putative transposase
MPRTARVVIAGTPHHLVQRGNRRQRTFFGDGDYRLYLAIAAEEFAAAEVEVWSYCLMPNHVHLIAAPHREGGLAAAMGSTHRRYTKLVNAREGWKGFLWQGRFSSFPMDEDYLIRCARYVGLNPVRAGLVERAEQWPWSSAAALLGGRRHPLLSLDPLRLRLGNELESLFSAGLSSEDLEILRRAGAAGRPLGAPEWVRRLEAAAGKSLSARPRGRPKKNRDTYQFPNGQP